ncbi:MAG: hypothetical protein J5I98_15820 [Phaeodactylibacter sp.]|nr:hypothetical protein [Phaeodactylibacter sp.]
MIFTINSWRTNAGNNGLPSVFQDLKGNNIFLPLHRREVLLATAEKYGFLFYPQTGKGIYVLGFCPPPPSAGESPSARKSFLMPGCNIPAAAP